MCLVSTAGLIYAYHLLSSEIPTPRHPIPPPGAPVPDGETLTTAPTHNHRPCYTNRNNSRMLQPPATPLGNSSQTDPPGAGRSGMPWIHGGQLGQHATHAFMRPPRSRSTDDNYNKNEKNNNNNNNYSSCSSRKGGVDEGGRGWEGENRIAFPSAETGGAGSGTVRPGKKGALDDCSDTEDAWSCCGRSVATAGRGCGPAEPTATVC